MQAELEKKTLLLQSISDRINPDAARTSPVTATQQPPSHTKPAHLATAAANGNGNGSAGGHKHNGRKKKRSERGEKGDGDREDSAAAKKARKCEAVSCLIACLSARKLAHLANHHTTGARNLTLLSLVSQ